MIGMAVVWDDHYFLSFFTKFFTTSKTPLVWTCLNTNPDLLITGCNQARYMSKGTSLGCLSPLYYGCSVRSRMTIDVHSFWLLILKAHHIRVQKNLHSLFGLWSKFHNGGSKVLTKQFFRNRSSDPSFEPKFYADQEFQ